MKKITGVVIDKKKHTEKMLKIKISYFENDKILNKLIFTFDKNIEVGLMGNFFIEESNKGDTLKKSYSFLPPLYDDNFLRYLELFFDGKIKDRKLVSSYIDKIHNWNKLNLLSYLLENKSLIENVSIEKAILWNNVYYLKENKFYDDLIKSYIKHSDDITDSSIYYRFFQKYKNSILSNDLDDILNNETAKTVFDKIKDKIYISEDILNRILDSLFDAFNKGGNIVSAVDVFDKILESHLPDDCKDFLKSINIVNNELLFLYYKDQYFVVTKKDFINDFSLFRKVKSLSSKKRQTDNGKSDDTQKFDSIQRNAILKSKSYPLMIITGGPGTGKSTVMKAVMKSVINDDTNLFLCAPTGKAAKRLSETTGMKTSTIHRLLKPYYSKEKKQLLFKFNEMSPLPDFSCVIVDESSMIDSELLNGLLQSMPMNGNLILVGDKNQLASVGKGAVLGDMLSSENLVPFVQLKNVYRQSKESGIAIVADEINRDIKPSLDGWSDIEMIETDNIKDAVMNIVKSEETARILNKKNISTDDFIVLSPQTGYEGGTININNLMSDYFNPEGTKIDFKSIFNFKVNDIVMLTENDSKRDVMNGDTGRITKFENGRFTILYDCGPTFDYPLMDLKKFIPSYACTIHKSQGSQYPIVIIPLDAKHSNMLDKKLVYTALTRAQKKVFFVGKKDLFYSSIKKINDKNRKTIFNILIENDNKKNTIEKKSSVTNK